MCGGSLCSDQPYSSTPVLVSAVRRQRDTQPVNRHRGGDLRRPRFFPNQNPSPLFRAPFPPRACLPCQCDVHQCHRMHRGLLFTQGFLLVVFDLLCFNCPVSPRCLLRTIGFCTAAFEPAAVSLTVPLTGSVVAVTQSAATTCSSDDSRRQQFRSHFPQVRFNCPCYLQVCGPWLPVWFSM